MGTLAKACIRFYQPSATTKGQSIKEFWVQFNPIELKIDTESGTKKKKKDMQKQEKKHKKSYVKESITGLTLSLNLMFDQSLSKSASVQKEVEGFLAAAGESACGMKVEFQWEKFAFIGTMNHVTAKYMMFAEDGRPLRANVGFSLRCEDQRKIKDMTEKSYQELFQ